MRQFAIRIDPPGLRIEQRASNPDLAVRAALHFHGQKWRKAVRRGMKIVPQVGAVSCVEVACPATYGRLTFTPGLRHNGQRIYRADPFAMIRAGEKVTTCRRGHPCHDPGGAGDWEEATHEVGDLLEASQGGMRSGLIIEIMDVDVDGITPAEVTPEMSFADGFTGDGAGARLMASFIAAEGGLMFLYGFRFREDLSFTPEVVG